MEEVAGSIPASSTNTDAPALCRGISVLSPGIEPVRAGAGRDQRGGARFFLPPKKFRAKAEELAQDKDYADLYEESVDFDKIFAD